MEQRMIEELLEKRKRFRNTGTEEQLARLAAAGKLTARQRIDLLLDKETFYEFGLFAHSQHPGFADRTPADGVVAGTGLIGGRRVCVVADDATVLAGTRGRIADTKLMRLRELMITEKLPLIALNEAGAARVQETQGALAIGIGEVFEQYFKLSGLVPLICVHFGASYGGPSFFGAQSDFTVLVRKTGFMGMSGPSVVKVGIGADFTDEEIGGAEMAMNCTGQVEYVADSEEEAIAAVQKYLSYFPLNAYQNPPAVHAFPAAVDTPEGLEKLTELVPANPRRAYSMKKLIELIVDEDSLFEIKGEYAKNLITALARMDGQTVGFVANNPLIKAGAIDDKASIKARKFVDVCDAFHIPLIFLCDTPGFIVGPEMEKQRIVSLAMRLMNSLLSASVPRVQIVIRKAVGMAYIAMCGRAVRPSATLSWPSGVFDVIGPEAAVMLAHGKEIREAEVPDERKLELLAEFSKAATPFAAAGLAFLDDIIAPGETRRVILNVIDRARNSIDPKFKHRIDP